jgi:hypothetical protein
MEEVRNINRKLFIILKIIYLLTVLVFITSTLNSPQFAGRIPISLFIGGIAEALLFLISIIFIHSLKWKLSFLTGILGCVIFGLNISYYRFISGWNYYYYYLFSIEIYNLEPLFSNTLLYFICWCLFLVVNISLILAKPSDKIYNNYDLKKEVLDLSTKFTRLEVRAISEKLNKDPILVLNLIKNMLENKEVYGEYFESTKTITFDQQANINEIDQLLAQFSEFEEKKIDKKK